MATLDLYSVDDELVWWCLGSQNSTIIFSIAKELFKGQAFDTYQNSAWLAMDDAFIAIQPSPAHPDILILCGFSIPNAKSEKNEWFTGQYKGFRSAYDAYLKYVKGGSNNRGQIPTANTNTSTTDSTDEAKVDILYKSFSHELAWFKDTFLKYYPNTHKAVANFASEQELKAFDANVFSLFLNHWEYAISQGVIGNSQSTKNNFIAKMKADMAKAANSLYDVDIVSLPDDDQNPTLKNEAFSAMGSFGLFRSNNNIPLTSDDIASIKKGPLSESDRSFLASLDLSKVGSSLSPAAYCKLVEIITSNINMNDVIKSK